MIAKMWQQSRVLIATAAVMAMDVLLSLIGMAIDPRLVGGVSAWLKPLKFGISTLIFSASIAWLLQYIPEFAKKYKWVAWALAAILWLEIGIIDFQAGRGVTSHFNISTVQDSILYSTMGTAIGTLWLLTIWISVALFQQRFENAPWGWALRLGMLISVLGSASGGLMTMPTAAQKAEMVHQRPMVVGAHTVGAPDGGPGLAGVGWSKEHGDLRISHFLGMHALQLIPFLAWWRGRRRTKRFVFATAGSYFALYLILTWQALRGESISEPSVLTMWVLGAWAVASIFALLPYYSKTGLVTEVAA